MAATKTDKTETAVNEEALRLAALENAARVVVPGHAHEVLTTAKTFLAFLKGEDVAND